MPILRLLAPAKVNLALEVLRRRADGYHDVRTVLQAVALFDELTFEAASDLTLTVTPEGSAPVDDNLVLRAAEALRAAAGVSSGAAITLHKRIPAAAGLGGGSSDAAATLLGLRRLWGLRLTDENLASIAASLGSDVPFFLRGGTALGEGRGDRLTSLPSPIEPCAVILTPTGAQDDTKTRRLYGLLLPDHFSNGDRSAAFITKLNAKNPVAEALTNTFEQVAPHAFTGYSAARTAFVQAGALHVLLSGAGPSLFTLKATESEAGVLRSNLVAQGFTAFAAKLLPAWDELGYSENRSLQGEDHAAR